MSPSVFIESNPTPRPLKETRGRVWMRGVLGLDHRIRERASPRPPPRPLQSAGAKLGGEELSKLGPLGCFFCFAEVTRQGGGLGYVRVIGSVLIIGFLRG